MLCFVDGGLGGREFLEEALGCEEGWKMEFFKEPLVLEEPLGLAEGVFGAWSLDEGHILRCFLGAYCVGVVVMVIVSLLYSSKRM